MTFKQAKARCRKVGTAHATGEPLAAMYADLVALHHGGDPAKYYTHLRVMVDDAAIANAARELMRDRAKAWDALMGVSP